MSRTVIVHYRVKSDAVDQNVALVRAIFEELGAIQPDGLRYNAYRVDERSFVHLATIDVPENPLDEVPAFRTFSVGIAERCEEGPEVAVGEIVGSYPLL